MIYLFFENQSWNRGCSGAVYGGRGVEKDLKEAEYLFRKAAEQGNEKAQKALDELEKGE